MPQIGYSHRPVALGRGGMVASCHPFATLTGVETLKAGGTAVDAAIATNAVLAVTQPYCCGVGGDLFCLYYEAATDRVHFLNGAGRSGSRATLAEVERRGWSALPIHGPAAVSVPGCARAWAMLRERFGRRPLAELLGPAIHYAEHGFPMTHLVRGAIEQMASLNPDPEWQRIFVPGGRVPPLGEPLVQADLARTLRGLGADGPDAIYRGRVAASIAKRLEGEGFVTADDLAAHTGEWGEPLGTTYRGVTVYETPPPTQGATALLGLNLLEGFPLGQWPVHSVEHLHLLIEMSKLAYADRDRYVADPLQARVPVAGLLDKRYAARRREAFDPKKAGAYAPGQPESSTTGFVVADGDGNVISAIQSLFNGFGSGVVPPGTGIVLNNRGRHFSLDATHPNVVAPRKRPFHTLIAAMLLRDGRPLAGFSTMGGNGQAMFHLQVLTNLIDYGMDMQEAIERPRFIFGAFLPGDEPDTVHIESRVAATVRRQLADMGHRVGDTPEFFYRTGHGHGIAFRDGTMMGGADPRGDGAALGY
ncbi:MAG: gamma-glutamyltransferase [Candidatus Rokubacteria bacterium]|nr:gamma-glutamyltransferase [Candidatus Rokubacteria bacterium]